MDHKKPDQKSERGAPRIENPTNKWGTITAVGLCVFMATLDVSIVNILLPTLVKEFDTTFPMVQWVILAYALVVTTLMLSVARLGDILPKKKIFIFGLGLFTLSSMLCGLSPSVGWLIAGRGLQGAGAVMIQALGAAIITEVFPPHERGRALGIIGSTVSVGLAAGPAMGSLIIGLVKWHWIFLINVPVGLIAGAAVFRYIPTIPPRLKNQRFDPVGAILMLTTMAAYSLGMTMGQRIGFSQPTTMGLLIASGCALVLFLVVELHIDHPLLDLRLFRNTLFSINLIMGFLVFVLVACLFIIPFFLELVQGYSTQMAGMLMVVVPLAMGLISPLAGSFSDRFGPRGISLFGLLLICAGCLAIATFHQGMSVLGYMLRILPLGLGIGIFLSPNNSAIMGQAPRERLGVVSGLMALSRTLGQTMGVPSTGVIFTTTILNAAPGVDPTQPTTLPPQLLLKGITGSFRLAAVAALAATALGGLAIYISRRTKKDESP